VSCFFHPTDGSQHRQLSASSSSSERLTTGGTVAAAVFLALDGTVLGVDGVCGKAQGIAGGQVKLWMITVVLAILATDWTDEDVHQRRSRSLEEEVSIGCGRIDI
jgi:hypothetical protein